MILFDMVTFCLGGHEESDLKQIHQVFQELEVRELTSPRKKN